MRGIKHFCGRQRSAGACSACDQYAAVSQNCGAVIDARGVERCARARGLRFRIENFRGGDEVAVGVASAGDQDPAIGERGGGVPVRGVARLSSGWTCSELEALTHVAIASMTIAPSSAKK